MISTLRLCIAASDHASFWATHGSETSCKGQHTLPASPLMATST